MAQYCKKNGLVEGLASDEQRGLVLRVVCPERVLVRRNIVNTLDLKAGSLSGSLEFLDSHEIHGRTHNINDRGAFRHGDKSRSLIDKVLRRACEKLTKLRKGTVLVQLASGLLNAIQLCSGAGCTHETTTWYQPAKHVLEMGERFLGLKEVENLREKHARHRFWLAKVCFREFCNSGADKTSWSSDSVCGRVCGESGAALVEDGDVFFVDVTRDYVTAMLHGVQGVDAVGCTKVEKGLVGFGEGVEPVVCGFTDLEEHEAGFVVGWFDFGKSALVEGHVVHLFWDALGGGLGDHFGVG